MNDDNADHDDNADIERALRRLDRPVRSDRTLERRRQMLDEFDAVVADDARPHVQVELHPTHTPAKPHLLRNRWLGAAAAGIVLIGGLVAVTRPSTEPTPPAATAPVAPIDEDPVAVRVRRFCDEQLSDVSSALQRYGDGLLGAGANVAPLKDAVVLPVTDLLDDLVRLGTDADGIHLLRADLETLTTSFLPVQVSTRVVEVYERLADLLTPGALPGSDTCDPQQLLVR